MTPLRPLWICLLLARAWGVQEGDMRLADGAHPSEGRVEIFYGGRWGTVCDNQWDVTDASVVCRALGFPTAIQAPPRASFGPGRGPIVLDGLECSGTEASLARCKSRGWVQGSCSHDKDAGAVCANQTSGKRTLDLSGELPDILGQLFDSKKDCDLPIRVEAAAEHKELSFCAHRLVLAANPEAQVLLSQNDSVITLKVDDECLPVVKDFIRYLYTRQLEVTLTSLMCFHKLASAYQAPRLQAYCGSLFGIMLPEDPSFQTPLDLYAYALDSQDPVLEGVCVRFLAWNFQALIEAEVWSQVPATLLRALLARSELVVPSELALLQALDAWSQAQSTPAQEMAELLGQVRFPMMQPQELYQLQRGLALYGPHQALFRAKILQALEFHTVPLSLLAEHHGINLTQDTYQPRLYTGGRWGVSINHTDHLEFSRYYNYYQRDRHFQTPQHPSFLFQSENLRWTLYYLPSLASCRSYGFSCSTNEVPALRLSSSPAVGPDIAYDNKALMLCGPNLVVHISSAQGQWVPIPNTSGTAFPCPLGRLSGSHMLIRPFYVTNTTSPARQ